jgi:flagellar motility protein MotE (MotC chaperone)
MWEDPGQDTRRRLSVAEAADALGVTVDAIRSRVKRGTIAHERKGGRVYVLLGGDESRPGHDQHTDQVTDQGARESEDRTAELIATLREQLQAERQAHAEARRIIAGLVERIPAIEAPQEPSEASETVEGEPERAEPHPDALRPQEGVQRPWWRRWFGS